MPEIPPGLVRIRVEMAGICGTDLELIKGYKGFKGVLGHEFVGTVDKCEITEWVGKRVVGEINAPCKIINPLNFRQFFPRDLKGQGLFSLHLK